MRETSALLKCRFNMKLRARFSTSLLWMLERCSCTLLLNYPVRLLAEPLRECPLSICSHPTLDLWTPISRSCWQDEQPRLTYGYDCRPHPQGAGRAAEQSECE